MATEHSSLANRLEQAQHALADEREARHQAEADLAVMRDQVITLQSQNSFLTRQIGDIQRSAAYEIVIRDTAISDQKRELTGLRHRLSMAHERLDACRRHTRLLEKDYGAIVLREMPWLGRLYVHWAAIKNPIGAYFEQVLRETFHHSPEGLAAKLQSENRERTIKRKKMAN